MKKAILFAFDSMHGNNSYYDERRLLIPSRSQKKRFWVHADGMCGCKKFEMF
jgi:hypothetical protein